MYGLECTILRRYGSFKALNCDTVARLAYSVAAQWPT